MAYSKEQKTEWSKAKRKEMETDLNNFLTKALGSKEGMDKLTDHYKISSVYAYSFYNSMMILSQGGTICQSKTKWKAMERSVTEPKGKYIYVLRPILVDEKVSGMKTGDKVCIGFKPARTWDVSQTEGKELEYDHNSDDDMMIKYDIVKDVMSKLAGADVVEKVTGSARGWSDGKALTVSSMSNDTDKAKTLIHETVHHLIHTSDKAKKGAEKLSRSAKEVEAESCTYLVLSYLGIDFELSQAYVSAWQSGIKDARKGTIVKTADKLIKALKVAIPEADLLISKM
jgi:hypothetical protein